MTLAIGFRQSAYGMVYPVFCLEVWGNVWATAVIAAVTQGLLNCFMFGQDSVTFELLYCLVLTVINQGMKEKGMEDYMMMRLVLASGTYMLMSSAGIFPQAAHEGQDFTLMSLFFTELLASIMIIFALGPLKVWLNIQSGETSLKDIKDGFEDRQVWMQKNLGVKPTVLPEANKPYRRHQ